MCDKLCFVQQSTKQCVSRFLHTSRLYGKSPRTRKNLAVKGLSLNNLIPRNLSTDIHSDPYTKAIRSMNPQRTTAVEPNRLLYVHSLCVYGALWWYARWYAPRSAETGAHPCSILCNKRANIQQSLSSDCCCCRHSDAIHRRTRLQINHHLTYSSDSIHRQDLLLTTSIVRIYMLRSM